MLIPMEVSGDLKIFENNRKYAELERMKLYLK